MAGHGDDISWRTLRCIVHDWIGTAAELAEVKPLHGGSINTTVALTTTGGDRAVLKIAQHRVDHSYVREAFQLNVLRGIGVPTPQVYSSKVGTLDEPYSYLLMEFIDGIDLAAAKNSCDASQFDHVQMHLADLMQTIHSQTHSHYTRLTDGERQEFLCWPEFYRTMYDGIWQEADKLAFLPVKTRKRIARIHERLDRFIGHSDGPRLVHGDLWSSNVMARQDHFGKWWICAILDPNCKYGHSEAELAYMELFRTVTPAFLRAYQSTLRLTSDYHDIRKPIYQMYDLLNHLQLFGAEYLKPLMGVLEKTDRLV